MAEMMRDPGVVSGPLIEWGVAARPFPGEAESGDQSLVEPFPGGVLLAVVDGLGHGPEAAHSAKMAVAILRANAAEQVVPLVQLCHQRLRGTRGVAITLASISGLDARISWLGVANVEGVLLRANPLAESPREYVVQRGGVVGEQLPPLRASIVPVRRGDTLIIATDGIRSGFTERQVLTDSPQRIANRILATHARNSDDALVLVARFVGVLP